jgi:hypothetical protein
MPEYYARFGPTSGLVMATNHMSAIHVYDDSGGLTPIGEALRADDEEAQGPALWQLTVCGCELAERYCLADNRFIPAGELNPTARQMDCQTPSSPFVDGAEPRRGWLAGRDRSAGSSPTNDHHAWRSYYADRGPSRGPLLFHGDDRPINVFGLRDDSSPIGTALFIGRTPSGVAVWKLYVQDIWLIGHWIVVDRRFRAAAHKSAGQSRGHARPRSL